MAAELLHIHPVNPELRKVRTAAARLASDGLIVYPTDTIYALGCLVSSRRAHDRLLHVLPGKTQFTLVCRDISQLTSFVRQLDTPNFKILKKYLPGPFTFILPSGPALIRLAPKRKTIGVRIPDHPIVHSLLQELDAPLLSASVKDDDVIKTYTTDPSEIFSDFRAQTDLMIDGGTGGNVPSTIVDLTGTSPVVIREGLGVFS